MDTKSFESLDLRIYQPLLNGITEIADAEGRSVEEVIRRALGLYDLCRKEEAEGRTIVIANLDNGIVVEAVKGIRLN
jgi:hypothetical protein